MVPIVAARAAHDGTADAASEAVVGEVSHSVASACARGRSWVNSIGKHPRVTR